MSKGREQNGVRYSIAPLPADLNEAVSADPLLKQEVAKRQDLGIGRSLRYAREELGLTQQAVADAMGIDQPRVSQIEGAEGHRLSLGVLARYAGAIGAYVKIDLMDASTRKAVSQILVSAEGARTIEQANLASKFIPVSFQAQGTQQARWGNPAPEKTTVDSGSYYAQAA